MRVVFGRLTMYVCFVYFGEVGVDCLCGHVGVVIGYVSQGWWRL